MMLPTRGSRWAIRTNMSATYDRPGKNWARGMLFGGLPTIDSLLTMPGGEALCVRHLRDAGVIHDGTKQTWIERDPEISDSLVEFAAEQNTIVINTTLERYAPKRTFDLINADTMGSFGPQQALAFEERLGPSVNPGGHIVVWVTEWARNPSTVDFRNWIEQQPEIIEAREEIEQVITDVPGMSEWSSNARESLCLAVAMFALAMHRYEFTEPMGLAGYTDGMPMIAMRFSGLVERDANNMSVTPFSAVYTRYLSQMVPPMTDEDRVAMERVVHLSNGTHKVEREGSMWVLRSPTGQTIMERTTLVGISKYY